MAAPSSPSLDLRALLAERAVATPETPFLFAREPSGHFGWWSWGTAASRLSEGRDEEARDHFLQFLVAAADRAPAESAEALLGAVGSAPRRPIWMTRAGSAPPTTAAMTAIGGLAAVAGGWAVLVEPGEGLHPETFLWARPSLLVDSAAILSELAGAVERLAPRFRRERWLSRRLRRLAWIATDDPSACRELERRWGEAGAAPRVLSIPLAGW